MRCKAKRRDGQQCGSHAVKGLEVCRMHGGSSPQSRAKRERFIAEQKAAREVHRLAQPIDTDPAQALLDLVSSAAGEVAYWRARVDEIQDRDEKRLTSGLTKITEGKDRGGVTTLRTVETVAAIEYRMWTAAQDRLAQYATAALRAGVQERQIKLAEDQGMLVAQVIRAVLDDLQLTSEQSGRVPEIVPRHLRLLASNAA